MKKLASLDDSTLIQCHVFQWFIAIYIRCTRFWKQTQKLKDKDDFGVHVGGFLATSLYPSRSRIWRKTGVHVGGFLTTLLYPSRSKIWSKDDFGVHVGGFLTTLLYPSRSKIWSKDDFGVHVGGFLTTLLYPSRSKIWSKDDFGVHVGGFLTTLLYPSRSKIWSKDDFGVHVGGFLTTLLYPSRSKIWRKDDFGVHVGGFLTTLLYPSRSKIWSKDDFGVHVGGFLTTLLYPSRSKIWRKTSLLCYWVLYYQCLEITACILMNCTIIARCMVGIPLTWETNGCHFRSQGLPAFNCKWAKYYEQRVLLRYTKWSPWLSWSRRWQKCYSVFITNTASSWMSIWTMAASKIGDLNL